MPAFTYRRERAANGQLLPPGYSPVTGSCPRPVAPFLTRVGASGAISSAQCDRVCVDYIRVATLGSRRHREALEVYAHFPVTLWASCQQVRVAAY